MNETATSRSISPQELHRRWREGAPLDIIDVRLPVDYAATRVPPARSVPFDALDPAAVMADRRGGAGEPLYVICQIGKRSASACERFQSAGFENVVNVEGGTLAWKRAGLPVVIDEGVVTPQRQVQMVAGLLVMTGALLGLALHPLFALVPLLVGAGQFYTGATGTCYMAMLLSRLPWNRRPRDRTESAA